VQYCTRRSVVVVNERTNAFAGLKVTATVSGPRLGRRSHETETVTVKDQGVDARSDPPEPAGCPRRTSCAGHDGLGRK